MRQKKVEGGLRKHDRAWERAGRQGMAWGGDRRALKPGITQSGQTCVKGQVFGI